MVRQQKPKSNKDPLLIDIQENKEETPIRERKKKS